MNALISVPIPAQSHEIIHDQIGAILKIELENQYLITYDPLLEDINVFKERHVPLHESEVPSINVIFERSDFVRQQLGQTTGDYRYHIEIVVDAKTQGDGNETQRGDKLSAIKLQKLQGIISYILEDPVYKTLGFAPPFIEHRYVENIWFAPDTKQDADYSLKGYVTLLVRAPRKNMLLEAPLLSKSTTGVKLDVTDKGYIWIIDNP